MLTFYYLLFCLLSNSKLMGSNSLFDIDQERPSITTTEHDFRDLLSLREQGLAGFHKNIDPSHNISPASDKEIQNWLLLPYPEKERLKKIQEEMYRQGKITMIVLAGGEATRFGQPKPFISVDHELGDFLEIKAANLNWMNKTYESNVPLFILINENRLEEFKKILFQRKFYGLNPNIFKFFVQGTLDTFIPTKEELEANFQGHELCQQTAYASHLRGLYPDGIYRFEGHSRKVPVGHFDGIASFIISGLFSKALEQGIEFAVVVNIDNLQALLKVDGMIAYFAEKGVDAGFLLTEKNIYFSIREKTTKQILQNKLIVRFHENILSFDGFKEYFQEGAKDGYRYVINQMMKSVDTYDASGQLIDTEITIKPEIGGTLVQFINETGELLGEPIMKEGFELPAHFDHANAPFFNTNTLIINLKSILNLLGIEQEQLEKMDFLERTRLVRDKMIKQIKPNFEFKYHEIAGEYPNLGIVKNRKTKIQVIQATRIMLQIAHLKGIKSGYIFAPRTSVWMPVREPEDMKNSAEKSREAILKYTLKSSL